MAIPIRLSDAVDLYDEGIQRVFDGKYKAAPETYKLLCDVGTSNLCIEKSSAFTGFSKAKQMLENESVQYESPNQGMDQSWIQREFGLGFAVTKRLWQFDQKNIKNVLLKSLLINGENLKIAPRRFMATLNKQIKKIIVQLQRLSEETFVVIMKDAIVRTCKS